MAGTYADINHYRLNYDIDGTVFSMWNTSGTWVRDLTQTELRYLQIEAPDSGWIVGEIGTNTSIGRYDYRASFYLSIIFPEPRDITAGYFRWRRSGSYAPTPQWVYYSTDPATNGWTGTWTAFSPAWPLHNTTSATSFKTNYVAFAPQINGVVALRCYFAASNAYDYSVNNIQMYGVRSATNTQPYLDIWHPTLDQKIDPAEFDWDDIKRGSSGEKSFRVKNMSTTHNAIAPVIDLDMIGDVTPTVDSQHSFSLDQNTYTATVALTDIPANTISQQIWIKRDTSLTAALGLQTGRIKATCTWAAV